MWVQAVDSVHAIPRLIFSHPHKTPGESLLPYPMLQMGTLRLSGEGHVRCEQSCPLGTWDASQPLLTLLPSTMLMADWTPTLAGDRCPILAPPRPTPPRSFCSADATVGLCAQVPVCTHAYTSRVP